MKLLAIVAVLGLTGLGLGSTAAHPAMAHNLFAHAAVDCYGYCLELSANNLNAGDADRITITFTLISITGTTTVTREIDFIPSGPTWTYVNCFDWPGAPLKDHYVVTATATLTTPSDSETVVVIFGPRGSADGSAATTLLCGSTIGPAAGTASSSRTPPIMPLRRRP